MAATTRSPKLLQKGRRCCILGVFPTRGMRSALVVATFNETGMLSFVVRWVFIALSEQVRTTSQRAVASQLRDPYPTTPREVERHQCASKSGHAAGSECEMVKW